MQILEALDCDRDTSLNIDRVVNAGDDPVLLRVFLSDGRSLVSFGEPARVGGRIVFSMPSSAAAMPLAVALGPGRRHGPE